MSVATWLAGWASVSDCLPACFPPPPQVLAALQFARETKGIWFLDPQAWVSQHLFKEESIWDIPLVKPRFTCAINPTVLRQRKDLDVADVLGDSLDFFSRGGKCENGQIDVKIDARRA